MSLIPYAFEELFDPNRHHFGLGIYPEDLWNITPRSLLRSFSNSIGYIRPWTANFQELEGAEKKSTISKDGFQVCLDVQHFSPNEISVKTVENSIIVEAKHEERKDDHGFISRQFRRRYDLPKGINVDNVVSTISSDGILTVKAPPETAAIEGNVRQVEIQQTGPARLCVKSKEQAKEETKMNE